MRIKKDAKIALSLQKELLLIAFHNIFMVLPQAVLLVFISENRLTIDHKNSNSNWLKCECSLAILSFMMI